jgi:hypothetical protein
MKRSTDTPRRILLDRINQQKRRKVVHHAERRKFVLNAKASSSFCDVEILCIGDEVAQLDAITLLNSKIIPFGQHKFFIGVYGLLNYCTYGYDNAIRHAPITDERSHIAEYGDKEINYLSYEHAKQYMEYMQKLFNEITWCFVSKQQRTTHPHGVLLSNNFMVGFEWIGVTSFETQKLSCFMEPNGDNFYIGLQIGSLNMIVGCLKGQPIVSTNFFHFYCNQKANRVGFNHSAQVPIPKTEHVGQILFANYWEYINMYKLDWEFYQGIHDYHQLLNKNN